MESGFVLVSSNHNASEKISQIYDQVLFAMFNGQVSDTRSRSVTTGIYLIPISSNINSAWGLHNNSVNHIQLYTDLRWRYRGHRVNVPNDFNQNYYCTTGYISPCIHFAHFVFIDSYAQDPEWIKFENVFFHSSYI